MTDLEKTHFGILTAIDWNSNKWNGLPTDEDIRNATMGYVIENKVTHTFLNFAHEGKAKEELHSADCPIVHNNMPAAAHNNLVKIIFIKSKNHKDGIIYLVGFYAFPIIEEHRVPLDSKYTHFLPELSCCIKAEVGNIHLLDKFIPLESLYTTRVLPPNTDYAIKGYNYLTVENVLYLLDTISPTSVNTKYSNVKLRILNYLN
jgi:hypothetical protein